MSEEHKQVMRELWQAVENADFNAIAGCYHPDAVYHGGGDLEFRGRDQVMDYYRAYLGAFSGFSGAVQEILAEGDLVAHRVRVSGTNSGEFLGAPPTGNRVEVTGMILSRFQDGQIIEEWEGFDQLEIMRQLGVG